MKKIVIFLTCLVFMAPSAWAGWTGAVADQNISQNTGNSWKAWYTRVAYNPFYDNLLAIWVQDTTYVPYSSTKEVAFSISTDFGVTWGGTSGDSLLSANDLQSVSTSGTRPLGLDIDSQGRVYVVWAEAYTDSSEIMISISDDGGHTWSGTGGDIAISYRGDDNNDAYKPAIAIDNNDNLHVVWHEKQSYNMAEIMYAKSVDGGLNWSCADSNRVISFPDSAAAFNADIAIAPNNDIYVVWQERDDPTNSLSNRIFYGKSTDGGQTFNSETADNPIGEIIRSSTDASIKIDLSGNIHVVWRGTRATSSPFYYDVYYTGSTDNGATWSGLTSAIMVDFGTEDLSGAYYPSLAVTTNGNLACVWNETPINFNGSEIWASYSFNGGATWTGNDEPELISFPADHPAYRAHVFAGIGDTLHVVWNEGITTNGYYDIHYSKGDTLAVSGGGGCDYVVGDVNGSDTYNGLDITYGVAFFKGGANPQCAPCAPCPDWNYCGDVNGSCSYNGLDITYGVAYFKGGALPIPCSDCPPIG